MLLLVALMVPVAMEVVVLLLLLPEVDSGGFRPRIVGVVDEARGGREQRNDGVFLRREEGFLMVLGRLSVEGGGRGHYEEVAEAHDAHIGDAVVDLLLLAAGGGRRGLGGGGGGP